MSAVRHKRIGNLSYEQFEKFYSNVDYNGPIIRKELGPCRIWKGTINKDTGYGLFYMNGKVYEAHRVSYFLVYGIDPGDNDCMHMCDNRRCVAPFHLFIGNSWDNNNDMWRKGRHPKSKPKNIQKAEALYRKNRGIGEYDKEFLEFLSERNKRSIRMSSGAMEMITCRCTHLYINHCNNNMMCDKCSCSYFVSIITVKSGIRLSLSKASGLS